MSAVPRHRALSPKGDHHISLRSKGDHNVIKLANELNDAGGRNMELTFLLGLSQSTTNWVEPNVIYGAS